MKVYIVIQERIYSEDYNVVLVTHSKENADRVAEEFSDKNHVGVVYCEDLK